MGDSRRSNYTLGRCDEKDFVLRGIGVLEGALFL